ncbi:ubiquitin 3 binding protein But2 C-terminal domain-domain-containing protein [Microdochium bolleyi]|uniref:Ubiquitin 3 binding protein But2 C-terminal domain-domain-containing protein n=1 Tax=Microdochium bolleyi TaxID=196109 RepID=A0A136IWZ5_9PEZI|nr:ubiquitin 3 binding protein But2 C-terminal domain-domain-containing protein [Microdochium bolleyi]
MPVWFPALQVLLAMLAQLCNSALVRQNAGCGFHIQTNGSSSFPVGELSSGQARAGSDMTPSLFTWFGDAFVDQQGRGCWWTPPTFLLQCDPGQMPDHGHEIGCDGQLAFRGQTTFYQCETGDGDQVNIYTLPSGVRCNYVTLVADDCRPDCPIGGQAPAPFPTFRPLTGVPSATTINPGSSTSPAPGASSASSPGDGASSENSQSITASIPGSVPSSASPTVSGSQSQISASATSSTAAAQCTPDLEGQSESPHLMVPVDSAHPDQSYGPSFYGQISPNASTLYNFDVPPADAGKTCTLFFDFPQADSTSTGYMWSGTGKLTFEQMGGIAMSNTTFNSRPDVFMEMANLDVEPGNKYVIATFPCPAGDRVTFQIREKEPSATGGSPQGNADTCLYYLQEHKPVPIGLFMSKC